MGGGWDTEATDFTDSRGFFILSICVLLFSHRRGFQPIRTDMRAISSPDIPALYSRTHALGQSIPELHHLQIQFEWHNLPPDDY